MSHLTYCALAYPASEELDRLVAMRFEDRERFYRDSFPGERLMRIVVGTCHVVFVELRGAEDPTGSAAYLWMNDGYRLAASLWQEPRIPPNTQLVLHIQDGHGGTTTELHDDDGCLTSSVGANYGGRVFQRRDAEGLDEGKWEDWEGDALKSQRDALQGGPALAKLGLTLRDLEEAYGRMEEGHVLYASGSFSKAPRTRAEVAALAQARVHRDAGESFAGDWSIDAKGRVVCPYGDDEVSRMLGDHTKADARTWRRAYIALATEIRAEALDA